MDKTETGKEGVLIVGGEEIPFTNVSEDISFDTSEAEYNDELNNPTAYTGKSATLTIECDGSMPELKSKVMRDDGTPRDDIRAETFGSEGGDRFTDGKVTSFNREYPGGDITTTEVEVTFDNHRPLSA